MKCKVCGGEIEIGDSYCLCEEGGCEHLQIEKCVSVLRPKLAAAEAANERLTRWRDLAVAAATAGAEQEVFKRFAESEAIQPIIQAWKDKVADLTERLAEADAARATDRVNLAAWVIRNLNQFGCFTGDCQHWEESECIQAIVNNYKEEAGE